MMMHRMSPLMASHDLDDDVSLTPPSPGKTTKQHSSPETWSKNDVSQDADNASDGKKSPTEQKDGQTRTYSYMSPISSDIDDIPEKPRRRDRAKQAKRQSTKSSHSKRRGSIKKTQRRSNISPAKSESELEDYISEVSQKKRGRARKQAKTSLKGSDLDSRNGVTGKAGARKRQNNKQSSSHVSTDSDSETFSDKLTKKAPTSKKSKEKCRLSTEKVERTDHSLSDLDSSRARGGSMSEDEEAKDSKAKNSAKKFQRRSEHRHSDSASSDNEEDVKEKPKKGCVKVTPKRKDQALKNLLGESDHPEQPTEGSRKPRVKKKERQGPRKAVPIECEICGRSIRCKAILERHMLSHTGEKPFECDECGKHYTSSSNLRIHQLSHSGKMDYVCNECGQKFTHLPYLKRHLLRHSGKKMHICEHCGKGFIQKYHLLRHILVHTRQTPHVCDKCGMSFNRTDYLKLHLRNVHLIESNIPEAKPEKLYKCETCNKSFASHTSLETHKRIHTGAMPYSCIICSRQFKQSSHLYSHMFTHSSEKPHACNLCELKFTRKTYLRKHKERVHSRVGESQSS
ncbi:hypothetical protein PHYPO_G00220290 [Pangasianodon hypophthalmus]|uniref:C2H2-type domain-containing protein n=2 Tax=Pangasianodon hypophthalmus TaxID=310915 RepID=A0A5N5NUK2_PANHP|nr:zinc finger protein 37 homolog isoform X1 [Pangasianodon hypophthalmus]KAB5571034.1 hypothetical protein PHYPO_G00220290 [Pangasianodon hypophthalmus]